jgi:hypothetical protein
MINLRSVKENIADISMAAYEQGLEQMDYALRQVDGWMKAGIDLILVPHRQSQTNRLWDSVY